MEKRLAILAGVLLLASPAANADGSLEAKRLERAAIYGHALAYVDRGLAANPGDQQMRILKGRLLAEQGRTREAIDTFQKLAGDYPELAEPYQALAVLYSAQGQHEKSRAALRKSFLPPTTARHGADIDTARSGSTQ